MAKKSSSPTLFGNPGMVLFVTFLLLYLTNSVVLHLAANFFPKYIVLGTFSISPLWAVLHSMGVLAIIDTFAIPFAHEVERWKGRDLTPQEWMIKYFFLNFIGIWIITRFSEQFGFGITSWWVAAGLALVLDVVQGVVMMQLEKLRTR